MISYNTSVLKGPSDCWLKTSGYYKGGVVVVPYTYYCGDHLVELFTKYDLLDATKQTVSERLPSTIAIETLNQSNTYGYRLDVPNSQYDNNITSLTIGTDPVYGLYLDNCYNMNNFVFRGSEFINHARITFEKNCFTKCSGTLTLMNTDEHDPIYFGDNCCTNVDLDVYDYAYVSRVGAHSFRNIAFQSNLHIGNIDPNCCVNMTEPLYFGNHCSVYSDLEPFILAHKDRCDELGIKALVFRNDCMIANADIIKANYSNYITYDGNLYDIWSI